MNRLGLLHLKMSGRQPAQASTQQRENPRPCDNPLSNIFKAHSWQHKANRKRYTQDQFEQKNGDLRLRPFSLLNAQNTLGVLVSLSGGFMKPTVGLGPIQRNTLTVVIHVAETILSLGYPLIGGFAIPTSGFNTILRAAPSLVKAQAQSILSFSISLIGGFVVPVESFVKVLRYALAYVIHVTEGVLGFHVTLICRFAIPTKSLPVVLR